MSSGVVEISGSVTIREKVAVPPGAVATVKLVDTDGEVLAATAFEVEAVPAAFTLAVDAAAVPRPDALLLWALLRVDDGGWGTMELAPVTQDDTPLVLTRVPAP